MARIRVIKVKGRKLAKPKVVYFRRDNLNKYSKKKKELRNSQIKYRQYSKSKGLEVDYDKTWVAKYNK